MVTIRRDGQIIDVICDDALEFMSVLDPLTGPFLQPPHLPVFLFRGVSSAHHQLLPAAYRHDKYLCGSTWSEAPFPTIREQCGAELGTIREFFDIAAENGIRLPEDSQLLRDGLDVWRNLLAGRFPLDAARVQTTRWPPPLFLSLIALAQHYGVPTRALDWTWSPLIAAYFAARDLPKATDDYLVVWVFQYFAKYLDRMFDAMLPQERPLILFTAPGADNENLRAQRGMFMLQTHKLDVLDQAFVPQSYDKLVPEMVAVKNVPLLKRVIVSSTQAFEVLMHLSLAGVSAARLNPGLWGVAKELEERRQISLSGVSIRQNSLTADVRAQIKKAEEDAGA